MTAAGRFWLAYAATMAALIAGLVWPSPAGAADLVATWPPGTRCTMTMPGRPHTRPAVVELGEPLAMFDGTARNPGYWVKPPADRADLVGYWMIPAAWLSDCGK